MAWLRRLLSRLFPCPWNDCAALWGCRCAKVKTPIQRIFESSGNKQRKAEERADDLARQAAQQAEAERQRLERMFAPTPFEQATTESAAKLTPDLERLLRSLALGEAYTPSAGAQEPIGIALARQFLGQAQDPLGQYQETLPQQLQLATEGVRQSFGRRGLAGSGLELEGLGRTGVDLAIKNALAREQVRQQSLSNAFTFQQASQGGLERFLGQEQAIADAARARQLAGISQGSQVQQAGQAQKFGLEGALAGQQYNQAIQQQQQMQQLLGAGLGAIPGFVFGGSQGLMGALQGAQMGASIASGNPSQGLLAAYLLNQQRQGGYGGVFNERPPRELYGPAYGVGGRLY